MGNNNDKYRIPYLDNVKGFLIILVVIGHVIQDTIGTDNIIDTYIMSFHMPLFMAVSGYCSYKENLGLETIKKRAVQLLIPFLAWAVVKSVLVGDIGYVWTIIMYPDRGLWFLQALFFISSIVVIVKKINNWGGYLELFFIWILLSGLCMGLGVKTFGLPMIGWHLPFFTFGFAMKQFEVVDKLKVWVVMLSLMVWGVAGYWCSESEGIQLLSSSGTVQHLLYRIASMMVAACAIIGWFGVFRHLINKKAMMLTYLGRKTLSIYSITLTTEIAIFGLIRPWTSKIPYSIEVVLLTIFLICFALMLGWLIEKNKYTKLLFLGKK